MRVAIDATPLLGVRTGVATFTGGLLRALASGAGADDDQGGPDLVGYALSARGRRSLPGALPPAVRAAGPPLPAGLLTRWWQRAPVPTAELLLASAGRIDVVHGTNYVVPPTRRAGRVVTVYDLTSVRFPGLCAPASRRYPALVRRAVDGGALVHVLASAIGDEVVELLGVPRERVRVVPSGLDAGAATGGDASAGRRVAGAPRYLLALGTVEPRKRVEDVVGAFDALAADRPDLGLVIAGPDGWDVGAVAAAVAAARHRPRIRRVGWVSAGRRADLLAGATVLAFPSVYEGFGYPPLEAMAAGTAVVAPPAGWLPEVLGDGAVLVPPQDVDALAGALATLVDDEAARDALVARGRARAAAHRWEDCARGMLAVYREAAP